MGHINEWIEDNHLRYSPRRGLYPETGYREKRAFIRRHHGGTRKPRSMVSLHIRCARVGIRPHMRPMIRGWFVWRRGMIHT